MASNGEAVAMEDIKVAVVPATTNVVVAKESSMNARIGSKPTLISRGGMKFLIMDAPRTANLYLYLKEMKKHNVTSCVRVCEPTYESGDLENAGIKLHDMAYDDGTSPPQSVISSWLDLVQDTFIKKKVGDPAIAVHCVAGLGRAPVLVAIALIEFADLDPVMAVDYIRKNRRGAINNKQLIYLEGYKSQRVGGCACIIS
mmetsp:Transcript_5131/g.10221  ORF Transcript_5131/g.10221 Transcript_5131/m.10221 type:complete len:200 (+) Transcript_5131:298-897(+)|eukprot:CAMPEP_0118638374 /NCGR_PEP_ID=MMETSP0785-20121206/3647_1 /TAXON_ID=91992 /ORGANISM="Bolidomonas pacifica, Strain CCMP 1866" /LENGTH=199 /DNA_ID=CAMNT_0006529613 /DNA_START=263 /DNA_END=862 /DNA_ORIENTATION=-